MTCDATSAWFRANASIVEALHIFPLDRVDQVGPFGRGIFRGILPTLDAFNSQCGKHWEGSRGRVVGYMLSNTRTCDHGHSTVGFCLPSVSSLSRHYSAQRGLFPLTADFLRHNYFFYINMCARAIIFLFIFYKKWKI